MECVLATWKIYNYWVEVGKTVYRLYILLREVVQVWRIENWMLVVSEDEELKRGTVKEERTLKMDDWVVEDF